MKPCREIGFSITERKKIVDYLIRNGDFENRETTAHFILKSLPKAFKCWGKVKLFNSNMLHAISVLGNYGEREGIRDMSFIKVRRDFVKRPNILQF
jgi:hypothetical protein